MPLTEDDKANIETLRRKLVGCSDRNLTYAAAGWADPKKPRELVGECTTKNGGDVGKMPDWLVKSTLSKARHDAEIHVIQEFQDQLNWITYNGRNKCPDGTLYIRTTRGACKSCRAALKAFRKKWGFRMVVGYPTQDTGTKAPPVGGTLGFGDAVTDGGVSYYLAGG